MGALGGGQASEPTGPVRRVRPAWVNPNTPLPSQPIVTPGGSTLLTCQSLPSSSPLPRWACQWPVLLECQPSCPLVLGPGTKCHPSGSCAVWRMCFTARLPPI